MPHRKLGYRFENDWPSEHLEYISQTYKAESTVPVNVKIKAEQHVLNMENVKRILSSAHTISVMDCYCRKTFGHCDAPVNVCLDLDQAAERQIAEFGAREMSDGSLAFHQDFCYGCGLCVSTCPTHAITLVDKPS